MELLPAAVAWVATSACRFSFVAQSSLGERFCPRSAVDVQELAKRLSPKVQVLFPGDKGFRDASHRWSLFDEPQPGVVVIPGIASDVAETVSPVHAMPRHDKIHGTRVGCR